MWSIPGEYFREITRGEKRKIFSLGIKVPLSIGAWICLMQINDFMIPYQLCLYVLEGKACEQLAVLYGIEMLMACTQ